MTLVVGIAGGTGSGKSTIARHVASALPAGSCAIIEYDSYYRDRSHETLEQRAQANYDHPDSLDTELLVGQLRELKAGSAVDVPIYDYVSHTRSPRTRRLATSAVVIVEGIMTLVDATLRGELDIKLYVDTDNDIRLLRRIRRDLGERGRSFESVREQYYRSVRPMHREFVEPSKRFADLIIPEGGDNRVALDVIVARLNQATSAHMVSAVDNGQSNHDATDR